MQQTFAAGVISAARPRQEDQVLIPRWHGIFAGRPGAFMSKRWLQELKRLYCAKTSIPKTILISNTEGVRSYLFHFMTYTHLLMASLTCLLIATTLYNSILCHTH